MSSRRSRTGVVLGALVAVTLALSACSSVTRAAGTDAAGPQQQAVTSMPTVGASSAPGPITVVAPASQTADPSATSSASASAEPPQQSTTSSQTPTSTPPPPAPAATVVATPALGSTGLAPIEPISIAVRGGTLAAMSLTAPDGKAVPGTLSADGTTWNLAAPLGYGKTYTVAGSAVNPDGVATAIAGTYVTATTVEPVTTKISPGDGAVVGVAAPVIIKFGLNPQDKALVEKHVKIVTTPAVEGAWAWVRHDGDTYASLDWRPKAYWPAGTKVHVESNIYGVKFADGWYGGDDVAVDFTIGRNQVVVANAKTHRMTVSRDGKVVATYNASLGRGDEPGSKDPNLVTRSGIHVVTAKYPVYKMNNPKYGYTNATEYWAVRISNNGEFIHNNPGTSAWQLANANVSHGCINLGAANAKAYFETAIYGDPVEIVGTSIPLSPSDGDIYDWAVPWEKWLTMSALSPNSVIS